MSTYLRTLCTLLRPPIISSIMPQHDSNAHVRPSDPKRTSFKKRQNNSTMIFVKRKRKKKLFPTFPVF